MKFLFTSIGLMLLIGSMLFLTSCTVPSSSDINYNQLTNLEALNPEPRFSEKVGAILQEKMQLTKDLTVDPAIETFIQEMNKNNAALPPEEITTRDEAWQQETALGKELRKQAMESIVSEKLMLFQETHSGFPEIFLTDIYGLVVATTNPVSDYSQADEQWWQDTMADGEGDAYYGLLEYDESAQSEGFALYAPVLDANENVIGILKAFVDVLEVKFLLSSASS